VVARCNATFSRWPRSSSRNPMRNAGSIAWITLPFRSYKGNGKVEKSKAVVSAG